MEKIIIKNNKDCELITDNVSVNEIIGNNLVAIINNYNLDEIAALSGHRVRGVTGSTSSLSINSCNNVDIDYSILNGDIRNHTFFSNLEFTSITPSTNMSDSDIPTSSRYLLDLGKHFEEIANSTGLTWSGPIA